MYRPRRRRLRALLAFVLLLAVGAAIAQLAGVSGTGAHDDVVLDFDGGAERWLVQVPADAQDEVADAARSLGGDTTGAPVEEWVEVELVDGTRSAADVEAALDAAGAGIIEPVLPRTPYAPLRFGEQWALSHPTDVDVDAPEAWAITRGAGAVVAVIDTGVDASHPDLVGRVLPGRDFSGASTPATVDRVGHGTQVASIIVGNGTNVAGVAPDAKVLPLKVYRDSVGAFSMPGYLAAIRYAADAGADVINISLGCGGTTACYSTAELEALEYATARGVLVVTAAGNGDAYGRGMDNDSPSTPDYPSGYDLPGILSVTSSTRAGGLSGWANYGRTSVDIAAPGESILVASANSSSHRSVSGTSFAAPHAAGVAALLRSTSRELSAEDLHARITAALRPNGTLAARTAHGGVLNAAGAVTGSRSATTGGGAAPTTVTAITPRPGTRASTPPVLTWSLPTGWRSERVRITGPGTKVTTRVRASARALSHPRTAWRSGTYRWQVQARTPQGELRTTTRSSYRLAPRPSAWVTSGRLRSGGRTARLRIGYAAGATTARVRVRVLQGSRVLHAGRTITRRQHVRGRGMPRRGWFHYDATLRGGALRVGTRVTVEVRVSSGGTSITRRFRAAVR